MNATVIRMIFLVGFGLIAQGCLSTVRVQQFVYRDSHPGFEMSTNSGVYRGEFIGIEKRTGRAYASQQMTAGVEFYHCQFDGLLLGSVPRHLQLYIPIPADNTYVGIMEETKAPVETRGREAILFVVGDAKQILGGGDLKDILENRYGISRPEWGKRPVLIEWRGDQNQTASISYYTDDKARSRQSIAEDRLDRIQRSRVRPIFGPLLYLISVPFDVVTFPIQAIIWLQAWGPAREN
jgi:hypothetical protein